MTAMIAALHRHDHLRVFGCHEIADCIDNLNYSRGDLKKLSLHIATVSERSGRRMSSQHGEKRPDDPKASD
jgi:hypothetical protein